MVGGGGVGRLAVLVLDKSQATHPPTHTHSHTLEKSLSEGEPGVPPSIEASFTAMLLRSGVGGARCGRWESSAPPRWLGGAFVPRGSVEISKAL